MTIIAISIALLVFAAMLYLVLHTYTVGVKRGREQRDAEIALKQWASERYWNKVTR